ncbi:MAG: superoxide dismutase [Cu-Zn] SodC2 [Betaproteobacteria bacterium]|nr:superoxide dismutase [Cu-Zn] SodC2 [Betaproteobacteria bacterium]
MKHLKKGLCVATISALPAFAAANELTVTMHRAEPDGIGAPIGTITAVDTAYGVVFTPDLSGLAPGIHGFHLHTNPDCAPGERNGKAVPALAAGGHFDPAETGVHAGPWGSGHLGDLPALFVTADGVATHPVLAPRLSVADLAGHSLMVHAGGDNHSDHPASLGGGGARVACGVIR